MDSICELDCRGRAVSEAGAALVERYNAGQAGDRFSARLDAYPVELKLWLLEAGMRHRVERPPDGGWRLDVERSASPAQGSVPGVHHVMAAGDSVWACRRAREAARLDAATGEVVAARAVARKASHIALSHDRDRLFVADSEGDAVIALRAGDLSEIARWHAPGGPHLPLASPDGIVCVTGGADGTLTIARPHAEGYRARTIGVGRCPHDPLLSADGAHLFVPCTGAAELVKVRLSDGEIVGRMTTGEGPSHLARHPDGTRIYSANSWDGSVSCVTAEGERVATASSGAWAHAIEVSPDGRWLYVANFLDDTLAVFDSATMELAALLATEPYPHGLDLSPDGRWLIATGFASDHVRLYDAQSHRELARIHVGWGSSHSALADDSSVAYVGCSVDDHVARVDLGVQRCVARVRLHG